MRQGAVSLTERGGGVICHSTTFTSVYLKKQKRTFSIKKETERIVLRFFLILKTKESQIKH